MEVKFTRRTRLTISRTAAFFLAGMFLLLCFAVSSAAISEGEISSKAAVLMDADTGQVLFAKSMNAPMYPASTTKIMTGLLAMENCSPLEVVTVSALATELLPGSSHIALSAGERLKMGDAMYALMLASANDAANAIAEHVSGSQKEFARLMNRRAREIGAKSTNFTNAHGLPDDNHVTTAYDMAIITREAMNNNAFMQYFSCAKYDMPATNVAAPRQLSNHQYMLIRGSLFYNESAVAGKVGYTHLAGHTMSTVASRGGRTLICVVMNTSRDGKFYDTMKLLDFGFGEPTSPVISGALPSAGAGAEYRIVSAAALAGQDVGRSAVLSPGLAAGDVTWFEPADASNAIVISASASVRPAALLSIASLPARMWNYALAGFIAMLMAGAVAVVIILLAGELRERKKKLSQ